MSVVHVEGQLTAPGHCAVVLTKQIPIAVSQQLAAPAGAPGHCDWQSESTWQIDGQTAHVPCWQVPPLPQEVPSGRMVQRKLDD